jgi:exopolyphosphatase/guanosine-5'-triphosphate,3'-diphosphate pyrophosphatase
VTATEARPARYAAIDVGTNTVLLLVAERRGGAFVPLLERAEITRLGRGVDASGRLDPAAIRETVAVLAEYAGAARDLGARVVACAATSAARDAANGAEFFAEARARAGLEPEVIAGDEEARLVWRSAWRDFGRDGEPLAVLDVGGGSTELSFGDGPEPRGRASLQVGAVRLTERHVRGDPPSADEVARLRAAAREAVRPFGAMGVQGGRLVAVAGTVTTLAAVAQALPAYDAEKVHGSALALSEVERLAGALAALTVHERAALPGMEPKRADVILAGAIVLAEATRAAGFDRLTVSDRGVRWGLLYERAERT